MGEVKVSERPARRVIGVPHRGRYDGIGAAFRTLGPAAGAAGLWPRAIEVMGVFLDDPARVPEAELRSLAGIAVAEDVAMPKGFEEVRLPAGPHAVLEHTGPYDGLPAAWGRLMAWLPASGRATRAAPACEIYLNSPDQVPPEALVTLICAPVA